MKKHVILKVPLLERLKFLAITGSNLDEFFMVRVGGLKLLEGSVSAVKEFEKFNRTELLKLISQRTHKMVLSQYQCFLEEIDPQLSANGIKRISPKDLK